MVQREQRTQLQTKLTMWSGNEAVMLMSSLQPYPCPIMNLDCFMWSLGLRFSMRFWAFPSWIQSCQRRRFPMYASA